MGRIMRLSRLARLYDLDQIILFEGKLVERLYRTNGRCEGPKPKYRVILSEDDYDYVVIPKIRKRLDRIFKQLDKKAERPFWDGEK